MSRKKLDSILDSAPEGTEGIYLDYFGYMNNRGCYCGNCLRKYRQYLKEKNFLADIHPKESAVRLFLNELPSCYHLVLNETKVYSGKNPDASQNLKEQICGTFDMLYWYDGDGNPANAGFVVFDYKTNANLVDEYNRQHGIMLLSPFDNLYQESLGEYTIQLSLYSLMLEDIGLNVIERYLIWLKDDGTYEKIALPNITQTLRRVL